MALGIALLFAGLFFDDGMADEGLLQVDVTPTPDRLAQPTLPAAPSQADHGAQVYWLSCLPCHGDRGQGLTDEFRTTYPPEEQYCWERGCHGEVPYDNGFKLPMAIPAVIGESSLAKFTDAAQLNAYIRATMPYWNPGSLAEDESWRVTAFILRANNLWDGRTELNADNAAGVKIPRGVLLTPAAAPQAETEGTTRHNAVWFVLAGIFFAFMLVIFVLKKRRNTTTI